MSKVPIYFDDFRLHITKRKRARLDVVDFVAVALCLHEGKVKVLPCGAEDVPVKKYVFNELHMTVHTEKLDHQYVERDRKVILVSIQVLC